MNIDHGTRRGRGCVSHIRLSGHRSSASSDGKTTTRQVGRTIQGWRTCGLTIFRGIGVFAACRSLLPFAFDRVTHDLLERCARREREASLEQYCAGYAICACCIRHRPFRPIRLRMVERVLAGDAITRRAVQPAKLCRLVGLYAVFAVWSACEIHERTEQQLADVWKAAAGGIRVLYHAIRAIRSRFQPRIASACSRS